MTFVILNILIIGLVGLIAYWWANQGLFSAILHLVAVIAAGTVAFALWEPLTMMQLKSTGWDSYAWGATLIATFTLALLIFRVGLDKLAPANVELPHWANLAFGFPVGFASGVITLGIVVIGAGFIQSPTFFMGLGGHARDDRTGKIIEWNNLWLPVHTLTADTYSYLSATAFLAPNSMRSVQPHLDHQAVSLMRDSFGGGKGAIAMPPNGADIRAAGVENGEAWVQVSFTTDAVDFNEQLTLSSAQIRLIGWPNKRFADAPTVHPYGFTQLGASYKFDSISYYATSTPGRESADMVFRFNVPGDFTPRYIQIRGTRFTLPNLQKGGAERVVSTSTPKLDANAPDITSAIVVKNEIRPINVGTNSLPSGVDVDENRFITSTGGKAREFPSSGRPPRNLRVEGFYAPDGTQIVEVRVDHSSPANVFDKIDQVPAGAFLQLVDANGNTYSPIAYMHIRDPEPNIIKMDTNSYVRQLKDLPIIPASSEEEFRLIFRVTNNAVIKGLMWGDVTIGTCNVEVKPQ